MSTSTPSQNGKPKHSRVMTPGTPSSPMPRSASSTQLALQNPSPGTSTPSPKTLSRSSSAVSISLEAEPQQIVYPHTISSVLNDPQVKHHVFVEPEVKPSALLVDAPLASYKPYLQRIHEIYSQLQDQKKRRRDQARKDSATNQEDEDDDPSALLTLGQLSPRHKKVETDSRKDVPSHFFEETFDLGLPATFYKTFYDGTPHDQLAEKIDGYLELVERDLTDKLNKRSDAFLKALRDLQGLHLIVASSFRTTEELKERLQVADDELVVKSLDIVGKKTRKSNYVKIQKLLRLVQTVSRSIPNIDKLIEKEQFFDALETIRAAENAMKNELKGAVALEGFQTKLERYNKIIKGHLAAQFVERACGQDVLLDEHVRFLRPLVVEMQHLNQLISTLETYSEIQNQSIKRFAAERFAPPPDSLETNAAGSNPFSSSPPSSPKESPSKSSASSVLANLHLNSHFNEQEERIMALYESYAAKLSFEEFKPMLEGLLTELLSLIVRIKEVHHLIDQVFKDLDERERKSIAIATSEVEANEKQDADADDERMKLTRADITNMETEHQLQKRLRTQISVDSSEIVYNSAELANTLIARLLRAREETHQRLPVQDFSDFYNSVSHFVRNVDKQVGRPCPTLRVVLNAQAKTMFAAWDKKNCTKLSNTLNAEDWARAEIAAEFAAILQCLYTPKQSIHQLDTAKETGNAKSLTLGPERYTFVNSELIFAKLLYDYLIFLDTLPSMHAEVITKIAEAIKLWSKLTYALVLRGGAVENQVVSGNINVGHLSLAANCLGVQIILIPKIKERVLGYIQDPQDFAVLSFLDQATEECTVHQQEIYSKMISTMRNRVDACFGQYKVGEATDKPNTSVVKLMEATSKMHKILKTYLPSSPFKAIFKQIVSLYNSQIRTHINGLAIKTPKEKQKLLNDVHFILKEWRLLEGVEDLGDELAEFVHERFKT